MAGAAAAYTIISPRVEKEVVRAPIKYPEPIGERQACRQHGQSRV